MELESSPAENTPLVYCVVSSWKWLPYTIQLKEKRNATVFQMLSLWEGI